MSKKSLIFIFAVFLFIIFSFYTFLFVYLIRGKMPVTAFRGGNIALIRINGTIIAGDDGGLGSANPEKIINQICEAEKDISVKAILLRINSPGGTAASSQEIYTELKRTKKPVIASIADIGASGAFWIACASDKIVASPASEVGSIGVILAIPNLKALFEKIGVDYVVITKGKFKDIGNPARDMTSEERDMLSEQADKIYKQFMSDVAESRDIPFEKIEEYATGQTFLGTEALEMGLIDEIGNYKDALELAAKEGGIEGEPEIIEYEAPSIFNNFMKYLIQYNYKNNFLEEFFYSPNILF